MSMKLSVIVPVFNMAADGKLNYCLDSLVNQTVPDYEIIAVDDCSTDNSLGILRRYEANYPDKFKVIASPVNKKQGGAKNLGLEIARGEWIGFIDSDDWIEKSFLENIKSMRIITFNDCSASDVEQVANRLRTIEFKDYEPGVTTTEGNTEMRVFIKTKGDEVKEIIIATLIENNVTLMQINGNLSIEDLEKLSKSNPIQQPTQ